MRVLRIILLLALLTPATSIASAPDTPISLPQYLGVLQQLRQSVVSAPKGATALPGAEQLPSEWRVQVEGRVYTVSTASLARSLGDYFKQRTPGNLAAFNSQLDLLLSNARGMQSAKLNSASERQKLSEILSRHEFRKVQGQTWYDRWKLAVQRWFAHLLERMLTSSAFPVVSRVIIWILLGLAVAVAALWVIRTYRQGNIYTELAGLPGTVSAKPWRDWQAEAQAAAQEGRWRDAVHLSYWAAISFLEAQGLWRPDRARTPREYLQLLPAGDTHRDSLQQLTRSFETIWYGSNAATAESFASISSLLERLGCR